MKKFIKTKTDKIPHWVSVAQDECNFWDGSLKVDTDPPTETKEPEKADPTPEPEKDTTPEPETKETEKADPFGEIKALFQEILTAQKEALKPPEPVKDETPEDTKEEAPTEDPKPSDEILEVKEMMRDLLISKFEVPDLLVDLVPKDPKEAKTYLTSDKYKELVKKLELVSKPLNEETKKEETKESKKDTQRDNVGDKKPKTFDEINSSMLADMFKDLV